MKKLLFTALISGLSFAQAQITFENILVSKVSQATSPSGISDPQNIQMTDEGSSVIENYDGSFITLGTKGYSMPSGKDIQMIKTNKFGNIIWEKIYGGSANDIGKSILQTNDGGYIFTGSTKSFGEGGSDVILIKTDSTGTELWSKTFGGFNDEEGESVQKTSNGGYIITGKTASYGAGGTDMYVIKTDSLGDLIWSKTFGGVNDDGGNSILETLDKGYLLTGNTFSFGAGNSDIFIVRLDENGVEQWSKTFGGSETDWANSSINTINGGFIIVGGTNSYGAGDHDSYVINIDSVGDEIWTKTFGGINSDVAYSLDQTDDGGFAITGETNSSTNGMSDLYVTKLDSAGAIKWSKVFGGSGNDAGTGLKQTKDGGFIVTGCTKNYQLNIFSETYFIKLNKLGHTLCNTSYVNTLNTYFNSEVYSNTINTLNVTPIVQSYLTAKPNTDSLQLNKLCSEKPIQDLDNEISKINLDSILSDNQGSFMSRNSIAETNDPIDLSFNLYPNPSDGSDIKIALNIEKVKGEEVLIVVYDMLGKEYFSKVVLLSDGYENVFAVDPSGKLNPGIYMVTATANKEIFSKRLIVR